MSTYKTVLDHAIELKDWGVSELLKQVTPDDRSALLEELMVKVGAQFDDAAVTKYYRLLGHAIEDIVFLPLLVNGFLPDDNTVGAARAAAKKTYLERTVHVLPLLPRSRKTFSVRGSQESEAALVETRRHMLEKICGQWCHAQDEEEADQLLDHLIRLDEQWNEKYRLNGRDDLVSEALRDVTNRWFPHERLLRYLTRVSMSERLCRTLAMAFVRNAKPDYFCNLLSIGGPVAERSTAAQERALSLIEKLAELDRAVDLLRVWLGGDDEAFRRVTGNFFCSELQFVRGTLEVVYADDGAVELKLSRAPGHFRSREALFDENLFHEWFDKAARYIELWQQLYPHTIRLKALATEYSRVRGVRSKTFVP